MKCQHMSGREWGERERERERENLYIKKLYWVVSNVPADFTPCYSKVDFYQQ